MDLVRDAVCLSTDTDGDGWRDDAENRVGPGGALSNPNNADSTPEYRGLSLAVAGSPSAPDTCSDLAWYVTTGDPSAPGWGIGNDGDGTIKTADMNCAVLAADTDQDGVTNASDNCSNAYNPEQLNTDGDSQGDACDADDDNHKKSDRLEMLYGGHPKNAARYDQAGFGLDIGGNTLIQVADVLAFSGNTSNQLATRAGTVP